MNRNRKNVVRLTESKLRNMIKESVRQILREGFEEDMAKYLPGQNFIQSDLFTGCSDNGQDNGVKITCRPGLPKEKGVKLSYPIDDEIVYDKPED